MPTTWNPLSLSRPQRSLSQAAGLRRITALLHLIYDALAEAQEMRREAQRRYPFIGS